MINVGRVLRNPRFTQTLTIYRDSGNGSWVQGKWTPNETSVTIQGIVSIASDTDLDMIPEGDRQKGSIVVHSTSLINLTNANGTSDQIEWRGSKWRVAQLAPYVDYGYYKAICVKMDPSTEVTA